MEGLWQRTADRIRDSLGQVGFETWIGPLNFLGMQGRTATIEAPNRFFRDWVSDRYLELLRQSLSAEVGQSVDVKLTLGLAGNSNLHEAVRRTMPPAASTAEAPPRDRHPKLNERYTFTEFVVGSANQFAHAAALAVANQPGVKYNPLFIYGGVGLGQDAPGHRDRPSVVGERQAQGAVHAGRAFHERADNLAQARPDGRVQGKVSPRRRAHPRRRPVPGRTRAHAGGVFSYLQRAALRQASNRADLGQGAARDSGARGAAAESFRIGADRRRRASRPRDAGRDRAEEGGARQHEPALRRVALYRAERFLQRARARGML